MFRKIAILLAVSVCLAFSTTAFAKRKPVPFPMIQGYGTVKPLPSASPTINKYWVYKVVFDVSKGGDPAKVNSGLDAVAETVNAFASAGVPQNNLKFVVVIHGDATPIVISDGSYKTRFHVANPNLDLINKLNAVGVQLLVDGQSLITHQIEGAEISSKVEVTLSAPTTLVIYQQHKYRLYTP
ncbi:MAG: DsrE family protein [Gammaproteobacteria bacterium]|nr:DsrE family protein [Gammaproteobacteria bacterium]MDE2345933.1 DsrE family protein [Gammaproteobacteria bacterium]